MEAPPTKDVLPNKEGPEVQTDLRLKETIPVLNQLKVSNLKALMPLVINYFTQRTTCFKAGQLTRRLSEWRKINSDSEVVNTVCGEKIEFNSSPLQNRQCKENRFSESENGVIAQEIRKLLDKGVIAESSYEKGEYISPIFLRLKPVGSHRLILNLKSLNQHVVYRHFKMDYCYSVNETKLLYGLSRPKRCLLLCANITRISEIS